MSVQKSSVCRQQIDNMMSEFCKCMTTDQAGWAPSRLPWKWPTMSYFDSTLASSLSIGPMSRPSVAKAKHWLAENPVPQRRRRTSLGTAAEVRMQLDEVARIYGADELMLVNIMPDHAARVRSYQLLADEYGLASTALAA